MLNKKTELEILEELLEILFCCYELCIQNAEKGAIFYENSLILIKIIEDFQIRRDELERLEKNREVTF